MDVFEKLKKIIVNNLPGVSEDQITMESDFVKDLEADSLDVAQIVVELEDQFGIEIPDDALTELHTVGEAVEAITKALG